MSNREQLGMKVIEYKLRFQHEGEKLGLYSTFKAEA